MKLVEDPNVEHFVRRKPRISDAIEVIGQTPLKQHSVLLTRERAGPAPTWMPRVGELEGMNPPIQLPRWRLLIKGLRNEWRYWHQFRLHIGACWKSHINWRVHIRIGNRHTPSSR